VVLLGIDPGCRFTGFCVFKKETGALHLLTCGVLKLPPVDPLPTRIGQFHRHFDEMIGKWHVTDLALETPFLGKNAQNFLKLGYLRGVMYLLSDTYRLKIHEFSPSQVKLALTGSGAAQKDQVARVILRLFPAIKTITQYDMSDALAVGLCGVWQQKAKISL
jgi:crossover junction endodeoxyribonuclease RuvC